MNQQQLSNSIKNANSISEIYSIMTNLTNKPYNQLCIEDYINAIKTLPIEFNYELILCLISDNTLYTLLEIYINRLINEYENYDLIPQLTDLAVMYKYLVYSLLVVYTPRELLANKVNKESLQMISSAISNCYITSDNYTMVDYTIPEKYLDIVNGSINANELTDHADLDNTGVIMYKHIIDIHGNIESRNKFIRDLYRSYCILAKINLQYAANLKFDKYFGDNTQYLRLTIEMTIIEAIRLSKLYTNESVIDKIVSDLKDKLNKLLPTMKELYVYKYDDKEFKHIASAFITEIYHDINSIYANDYNLSKFNTLIFNYLEELKNTPKQIGSIVKESYYALEEETSIDDNNDVDIDKPPASISDKNKKAKSRFDRSKKINLGWRKYKEREKDVNHRLDGIYQKAKRAFVGDIRTEMIEGRDYSPMTLLKKLLGTAAVFAFGPIKGIIFLVVRHTIRKNATLSEKRKAIMELETEITMLDEKIKDASNDNNRQAKYAMMRTRKELENAINKIKYNIEADRATVMNTSTLLKNNHKSNNNL